MTNEFWSDLIQWILINIIRTIGLMVMGITLLIPFFNILFLRAWFDMDGHNSLRGFAFDCQWIKGRLVEDPEKKSKKGVHRP